MHIWLKAARPKTLIASICPVLMGITLALSEGVLHPLLFFFTLSTAMGVQIAANFVNDYFDFLKGADGKERKGPTRVMQEGLVSVRGMKRAIAIVFSLTFLSGCVLIYRGGMGVALLLLLSLLLAFAYTAGPYPLAYLGLSDLFVLLFFGPIAVLFTYYLQTQNFSSEALLAGISPGCLSSALLIANNVRDVQEDRQAHKKTLVVRFGTFFGKVHYCTTLLAALIPMLFFRHSHPFSVLTFLTLIPALPLLRTMCNERNPQGVFMHTGKLLWIFTFLFCVGWML